MPSSQESSIHNHAQMPARPDLIRLIIGIFGIGSSGPLIALSAMSVPTLIFWRNLGGSLITLPFAIRHKVDREGARWAILAGVVLSFHFMGFFLAMRLTSVAAGTAIAAIQPIFAALFLKLRGGEIPNRAWLGMLISFAGVIALTGIDIRVDARAFLGDLAALISGALAAAYMILGSRAQRTLATTSYTTICYFSCALTALPFIFLFDYELLSFAAKEWVILAALIVGAQLLGHTMFNITLKRVSPAIVSMIIFFEVPVAALLAFIFQVGKQPSIWAIPAVAVILFGCILVVGRTRPEKAPTLS
jgi:drug/metabolite transporter (DMT)-like permease